MSLCPLDNTPCGFTSSWPLRQVGQITSVTHDVQLCTALLWPLTTQNITGTYKTYVSTRHTKCFSIADHLQPCTPEHVNAAVWAVMKPAHQRSSTPWSLQAFNFVTVTIIHVSMNNPIVRRALSMQPPLHLKGVHYVKLTKRSWSQNLAVCFELGEKIKNFIPPPPHTHKHTYTHVMRNGTSYTFVNILDWVLNLSHNVSHNDLIIIIFLTNNYFLQTILFMSFIYLWNIVYNIIMLLIITNGSTCKWLILKPSPYYKFPCINLISINNIIMLIFGGSPWSSTSQRVFFDSAWILVALHHSR